RARVGPEDHRAGRGRPQGDHHLVLRRPHRLRGQRSAHPVRLRPVPARRRRGVALRHRRRGRLRQGPHRHAGRAGLGRRRPADHLHGEHPVLAADRRARRARRAAEGTHVMAPARDVAVVATAQTVHRRAATELSEVEMIQTVIAEVLDAVGGMGGIDFTCSGSTDYLAGQAFSFVMTLDAVPAYLPIVESHVEMDGAWALYEAWLKIQAGHADTALVYGYSKASPGDLPNVM